MGAAEPFVSCGGCKEVPANAKKLAAFLHDSSFEEVPLREPVALLRPLSQRKQGCTLAAITQVGQASGTEPFELPVGSVAAARLYERHAGQVLAYCLSRLGRREDAEDAVQTTFLEAMRSLRRGVVPLVESAWLIGIARNVCRARWEAAGRERLLESACDPVELDQGAAAPSGRSEELIGLEEALARLPEQQRRAVLLRDWRGLSYEEVAAQLGVSLAAVETLIFRGRRTLAEHLREEPQQTRRRLASLGNLGSLVTAVKMAFTGAAAVSVTAVALGGAGGAITSPPVAPAEPRAMHVDATLAAVAARPQVSRASAPGIAVSPRPARTGATPANKVHTAKRVAPIQAVGTGNTATLPAAPPVEASKHAASAPPTPKPIVSPPPVSNEPVAPITGAVESLVGRDVVEQVAETAEPVTAPVTAIVADPIPALPPVTVTPPAPVPLPPVTVTPPELP